jgi:DNA-binding PadR family transcriptional regulator
MSKSDILNADIARDFRKGLLKFFILKMLARQDMHGYAMMARIEEISGWKPSSGSMYPALAQLQKNRLITMNIHGMRSIYSITNNGKEMVKHLDDNFDEGLKAIRMIFDEL